MPLNALLFPPIIGADTVGNLLPACLICIQISARIHMDNIENRMFDAQTLHTVGT